MKKSTYTIILVGLILLTGCKKEYVSSKKSLVTNHKPVRIIPLQQSKTIDPIVASGILVSKEEAILSFKIQGIVQTLNVSEGEHVDEGQTLARLNLAEIDAQLERAKNVYDKSLRDFERATNLYKDTVGTLEQVQNAKTQNEIAKSNLVATQFNRKFSIINSPYQGSILKKFVEAGEIVSPGQPIYKIGSTGFDGSQGIRIGLSDKDIVRIKLKDSAAVSFDAFPKRIFQAVVTEIASSANGATGLYNVELTIEGFHEELKNGFIGKVSLYPDSDSIKYHIPIEALVEGNGSKAIIFITDNGSTAIEKEVDVWNFGEDYMVIDTEGIPEQASVIVQGAAFLRSNDSIHIIK